MRKFFAVKGVHDAERMVDINGKAHVVTRQGTFKMRDNMHSNTFLVGTEPIQRIYDLSPIDYSDVYECLEPCSIRDAEHSDSVFVSLDGILSLGEIDALKERFYLVVKNGRLGRLDYADVVKTLQYIQSLGSMEEFCLYGDVIKKWAEANFGATRNRDISLELGFFILLRRTKSGNDLSGLDGFLDEWRRHDLEEPDLRRFSMYLDSTFIRKDARIRIKSFLARLV